MRPILRTLLVSSVLALAACKGGGAKSDGPKPKNPSVTTQSVKAVDANQAAIDFQVEANAIKQEQKGGKVDYEDVVGRMKDITKKHPTYALAWYNMGVAFEGLGQVEDAEKAYMKTINLDDKMQIREARENLAAIQVRRGESGAAVSQLRELVNSDKGAANARVALAYHHMAQGEADDAQRLCEEALTYQPTNVGAYCVLSHLAVQQKDYLRARLLVAQGLKLGDEACLHHALGLVALAEKETANALVSLENAVSKDPTLVEARFRIAQISMSYKDFRKAIANYEAVAHLDAKNVPARVNLGVALKGSGRFPEAEAAYKTAIAAADSSGAAEAHYNLGVLYLRNMNRLDDAKTELKRYLQLADSNNEKVFQMLEEIDQTKAAEVEGKRMEEEAARQAEIDAKLAEEEAKKQAEKDAEAKKEKEAEEKRKASEPPDPTPPVPAPPPPAAANPPPRKKPPPAKGKPEKEPDPPPPTKDFE